MKWSSWSRKRKLSWIQTARMMTLNQRKTPVMRKFSRRIASLSSVILVLVLTSLTWLHTTNWSSMLSKEITSHNSRFQTHARKQQLPTSCSPPHQFQWESCQTVVSFQHLSVNQSRLSGRRVNHQTLLDLRTPCSLSRLCLSPHKWTLKNSANN